MTDTDPSAGYAHHTTHASYRERLIEHLFLAELMRRLWRQGITECEVLRPQVDDAGYDLVIEANRVTRHIQLKSSFREATTGSVKASLKLSAKPSACVLWVLFDEETLELGPFLFFGGGPGERLPDIHDFRVAKHTRGPVGAKKLRPNQRLIPRRRFDRLPDMEAVTSRLFGDVRAIRRRADVLAAATRALGSADKALGWLASPVRALGGLVPDTLVHTEAGAADVLAVLERLEHGVFS